jgi:phosphoenolpyruvate synthase/pyruvate phosphate dikinase
MKYKINHLKENLNKWKNKKWYHQRFDGSPYFIHLISEAEIAKHNERKLGCNFSVHYCFYSEGKADWYILQDDIEKISNKIIELSKDKDISKYLMHLWEKDEKLFYDFIDNFDIIHFSNLSNDELLEFNNKFMDIILNRHSSSSIIDGFALGTDDLIANKIKDIYESSELKQTMRFNELFSALTAPIHLSFINESEISLIDTALFIKNNNEEKLFEKEDVLKYLSKESLKKLENHQKNNFYMRNNYVRAKVLNLSDFVLEIKILFSSEVDLKLLRDKIFSTPSKNKEIKKKLIEKLNLPIELIKLIKITEDFTHWQDMRKKSTFLITHYGSLILNEISLRSNIPLENLKYLTHREINNIFVDKQIKEILIQRRQKCVYYWDKNGMECLHENVDKIASEILSSHDLSDLNDFRGLSAMTGKAKGKVKIIKSATEINNFEKNEVLVAVMTRPDYLPAMKKACAIVTDEGGITSHAAIVSRELGIPCIIGTKIATKILKDGMLVEVNANHGLVKILGDENE